VALTVSARIGPEDLPEEMRSSSPTAVVPGAIRPLEDIEREYILAVLEANQGNRTKTAEQLEIGPATLFRKLKAWGEQGRRLS
jgi:transcriptional regulator of acetoin/glycerol metabolism